MVDFFFFFFCSDLGFGKAFLGGDNPIANINDVLKDHSLNIHI